MNREPKHYECSALTIELQAHMDRVAKATATFNSRSFNSRSQKFDLGVPPNPTVWTDVLASELVAVGDALVGDFHIPSWSPRLYFRLRKP